MYLRALSKKDIISRNKKIYFNVGHSSQIFKSIMNDYLEDQKLKKQKKHKLIYLFDQQKRKIENKESEKDFLFRDLKHLRRMNQEILNQYGGKAKEGYYNIDSNKYKMKMEKNLFFDDEEKKNKKHYSLENLEDKKFIYLPKIFQYNKNVQNLKKNLHRNNYKSIHPSRKESQYSGISNESNFTRKKKPSLFNLKSFDGVYENHERKNSINEVINNLKSEGNKSQEKIIKNNKKEKKNELYIDTLDKARRDFIRKERRFNRLFTSNDYGCKESNKKYNYTIQHYFED